MRSSGGTLFLLVGLLALLPISQAIFTTDLDVSSTLSGPLSSPAMVTAGDELVFVTLVDFPSCASGCDFFLEVDGLVVVSTLGSTSTADSVPYSFASPASYTVRSRSLHSGVYSEYSFDFVIDVMPKPYGTLSVSPTVVEVEETFVVAVDVLGGGTMLPAGLIFVTTVDPDSNLFIMAGVGVAPFAVTRSYFFGADRLDGGIHPTNITLSVIIQNVEGGRSDAYSTTLLLNPKPPVLTSSSSSISSSSSSSSSSSFSSSTTTTTSSSSSSSDEWNTTTVPGTLFNSSSILSSSSSSLSLGSSEEFSSSLSSLNDSSTETVNASNINSTSETLPSESATVGNNNSSHDDDTSEGTAQPPTTTLMSSTSYSDGGIPPGQIGRPISPGLSKVKEKALSLGEVIAIVGGGILMITLTLIACVCFWRRRYMNGSTPIHPMPPSPGDEHNSSTTNVIPVVRPSYRRGSLQAVRLPPLENAVTSKTPSTPERPLLPPIASPSTTPSPTKTKT